MHGGQVQAGSESRAWTAVGECTGWGTTSVWRVFSVPLDSRQEDRAARWARLQMLRSAARVCLLGPPRGVDAPRLSFPCVNKEIKVPMEIT